MRGMQELFGGEWYQRQCLEGGGEGHRQLEQGAEEAQVPVSTGDGQCKRQQVASQQCCPNWCSLKSENGGDAGANGQHTRQHEPWRQRHLQGFVEKIELAF